MHSMSGLLVFVSLIHQAARLPGTERSVAVRSLNLAWSYAHFEKLNDLPYAGFVLKFINLLSARTGLKYCVFCSQSPTRMTLKPLIHTLNIHHSIKCMLETLLFCKQTYCWMLNGQWIYNTQQLLLSLFKFAKSSKTMTLIFGAKFHIFFYSA